MTSYPSPLITERWAEWERRLARLEAFLGSGLAGSDQTIKGSHDRLDALLGAGVAVANLANNIAVNANVKLATIAKGNITDNVATGIFTVTTTNETGDNDGGGYSCWVFSLVGHGLAAATTNAAARGELAVFTHVNKNDGSADNDMFEIHDTITESVTDGAARGISTIAMTAVATSNYVTTFTAQVDLSGTDVEKVELTCFVVLAWYGYSTAPVIAAA